MGWGGRGDGCLAGVYSVDIDASAGLATVSGEVDPNMLLKSLARTGMHAEIAWASFKHPMMSNNHHRSRSNCHSSPFYPHCNYSGSGGGGGMTFPQQYYWWNDNAHHYRNPYPIRGAMPWGGASASYGTFNDRCYGSGYMPSSSSSSYYSHYADDRHFGTNCNIMWSRLYYSLIHPSINAD